ncbi:tRNA (adenosine(37)-N6)-threonylcarbamoyltransferase complex dimerization subunit type 1 TsaB [Alkalibacterium thalassium]|uniref:tRNA threonylcarbamoyladenosine biosynthesis protein TsaB n=1 Tax=Alkalibacterium thalassium TaxID=426701 RepID=A0A1G8ZHK8_9LACT|nr:tRNA (adenosine(37)-N6)-threonylcarbamoyltransferase complex dimerization subunit type 1 TsaB [Alkalibacterium thalassium]SDK13875.1 tRNA threonylcarbamoyladenosine biosynthesis protein TsaB [Alkalibacterium thalassium]
MKTLGIDTSNQVMSVALTDGTELVLEKTVNIKRNHSVQLMPAIEELVSEAGWKPKDIERVVVARGPGSYTGVRIGVTVAKTLAYSLNAELVGLSSLHILAGNGERVPDSFIVPVFDARRGNIYTGLYKYENTGFSAVENDTHISAESWAAYLSTLEGTVQLVGQDAARHFKTFKSKLGDRLITLPSSRHYPRASVAIELGQYHQPEPAHLFEPEYLKRAEAEQNWMDAHPEHAQGGGWIEKL